MQPGSGLRVAAVMRARSGAGRLALAMPSAQVVCAAISGSTQVCRFPIRPRLRITFFLPSGTPPYGESAQEISTRLAGGQPMDSAYIATEGMRLFEDGESIPLKLLSSQTFETGVLYLIYARADAPAAAGYDEAKAHLPQNA